MTGNIDMHLLVTDSFKRKGSGVDQNQSVSGVTTICLMQRDTSYRVELIRLLIVECCPTSPQRLCEVSVHNIDINKPLAHTTPYCLV
jgi:hypothetical protein